MAKAAGATLAVESLELPGMSKSMAPEETNRERPDTLYWVSHPEGVWMLGEFKGAENGANVYTTELGEVSIPAKDPQPLELTDPKVMDGVADICELDQVTTATVLDTIRTRYKRGEIYTNISRILIAVNPFKGLDIYGGEFIEMYSSKNKLDSLPPHVFQIASDAFNGLREEMKGQSVLISGESGAGKSETTKLVMFYASEVLSNSDSGFVDQLLRISPVLEAFGNAKTTRNYNSSRFSKWIEVLADPSSMTLSSASVTEYLLELPRVCNQGPGERNYHIFYQLAADTSEDWEHLKVLGASRFKYLNRNPAQTPDVDDISDFRDVCRALATLKVSREEIDATFRTVSAVLHLGQLEYEKDKRSEGVDVTDKDLLSDLAELMGVPMEPLLNCLCYKRLTVNNETVLSPFDLEQANTNRNNVAKLIYGRLFSWIVARCNMTLKRITDDEESEETTKKFIGVLDIAGFEKFETNMLEQLLINLSNEKLQQVFIHTVFKQELADYAQEGIPYIDVFFNDNKPILELLEGKNGILSILDDATTGVKQTDQLFTSRILKDHGTNPAFIAPKFGGLLEFGIVHYAGEVLYSTQGFLEKNQLSQPPEVLELMEKSSNVVLRKLAPEQFDQRGGRKVTIGSGFRKNLNELILKLQSSSSHFIRCVKPNSNRAPGQLDAKQVVEQMTSAGIQEAVKLRKSGYALRQTFKAFLSRYLMILSKAEKKNIQQTTGIGLVDLVGTGSVNVRESHRRSTAVIGMQGDNERAAITLLVNGLPAALGLNAENKALFSKQLVVGKTKVFVKDNMLMHLEKARNQAFVHPTVRIQAWYRGWHTRKNMREVKVLSERLDALLKEIGAEIGDEVNPRKEITKQATASTGRTNLLKMARRATVVEAHFDQLVGLIDAAMSCPLPVQNVPLAVQVRKRLNMEANMARQMQDLQTSMDLPAIEALLERAMRKDVSGALFDKLKERSLHLKEQLSLRNALRALTKRVATPEEMEKVLDQVCEKNLVTAEQWIVLDGFTLARDVRELLEQARNKEKGITKVKENPVIMAKVRSQAKRWIDTIARRRSQNAALEETRRKIDEEDEAKRREEEETERQLQDLEWQRAAAWDEEEEEEINQKIKGLRQHQMQMVLQEKEAEKEAQATRKQLVLEEQMARKKEALVETILAVQKRKEEIRESELTQVKHNLDVASKCFDAPELQACFNALVKLGVDIDTYSDEHDLFLNLQNVDFVEEKIKDIQEQGSKKLKPGQPFMYNLLALSNLDDQLKVLVGRSGFIDEGGANPNRKREIMNVVSKHNRHTRRGVRLSQSKTTEDQEEEMVKDLLAEKLFKDLANYTYLRDPWNPGGRSGTWKYHVTYEEAIAERLHHSLVLEFPLTAIKDEFIVPCRRIFWNILRAMGDKATPYKWEDKHKPVIDAANRTDELREEVFMQMMKQLTGNPSTDSNIRGWGMLQELCKETLPSYELIEFLKGFCKRATDEKFHPSAGLAPEGRTRQQLGDEGGGQAIARTNSRASGNARSRGGRNNPDRKYHKNGWGYINPNFDSKIRELATETLDIIDQTLSRLEKEWQDWGGEPTSGDWEGWEGEWQEAHAEEDPKEGGDEW